MKLLWIILTFKSILVTAPLPLLVACGKPTPRISRHTLPCNCEHIIDGKAQVLKIADYKTEMIFEYLISKLSLAPRNFILCYAKMKDNSGMARVFKNTNFVYIDPEDTLRQRILEVNW
ncbi:MAG: hypothetical protein IPF93_13195 [Saprospiraceae bacterium]|nr:hypothetical protein [Saprospiraceae bacterium]